MTDKDQIQPIITAYLSGKATAEERRKLDDWVKQSTDIIRKCVIYGR